MRKSSFVLLILIIFLLGGCAIFRLPFREEKDASELIQYFSLNYINPSTGRVYNQPIKFPATVTLQLGYNGYTSVSGINLSIIKEELEKTFFEAEQLNPNGATVNFFIDEYAGDYIVNTELIANNTTALATKLLQIVDTTSASITDFNFYLTQNATLIPNEFNDAFLWMKIEDEESFLFSKKIVTSFVQKSKMYINGRDLTSTGFPPNSAIVSDSGKQVICIAKFSIPLENNTLQTPFIFEGQNDFLFVFEGFNSDGSGLIEKKFTLTAAYPDNTAPDLNVNPQPVQPAVGSVDFAVTDEFTLDLSAVDTADKTGYPPSGLKKISWSVHGESNSATGVVDLTYLPVDGSYDDIIPIRLREKDFNSGIYRLVVTVEDRNGNQTIYGPKTFSYNLTDYKMVDIKIEKVSGDMGALLTYYAGEDLRFTLDTEESLEDVSFEIPGVTLEPEPDINAAYYRNIRYGDYLVSVSAKKNSIPYIGEESFTVQPTPTYNPGPVIEIPEDPTEPSKPFKVIVKSLTTELYADPIDTLKKKRCIYIKDGNIEPTKVEIFPENYIDLKKQTFKVAVLTVESSPILLDTADRIELTLEAEDIRGRTRERTILFTSGGE